MVRMIKTLSVLSFGPWFFLAAFQPLAAQQLTDVQLVDLKSDPVGIADFGLENEVPSAIDLVGPDQGTAGRNRAALAHRLQCWIDGTESCSTADRNDPRVRAMRRFLGLGPEDHDGAVIVHFADQSSIKIRLARVSDLGSDDDWTQSVYEPIVLPDTARAPGLPDVPSRPDQLVGLAYEGPSEVLAALERLKQRMEATGEAAGAGSDTDSSNNHPALAQEQRR